MSSKFVRRWHVDNKIIRPTRVYLSASKLEELIKEQLDGKLHASFKLYLADGEYYCPSVEDAEEIIRNSAVDRNTWVEERFDCDDFALVLKAHFAEAAYKDGRRRKAHCFGIVWGMLPGGHAINWMVNADLKLRFVEPQTDEVFFPRPTDRDIWFMLC